MDCSTEVVKSINTALRREGFKVKPQKDKSGRFWLVEGSNSTKILEYRFFRTNLVIAPSRADRSCQYLNEWSFVRYLIRAIQASNPLVNDFRGGVVDQPKILEVTR